MAESLLLQAAQAAAGTQQYPKATLYMVATPIGNLADISLRAVQVLALADRVACEDTRHSGALLHHLGLHKPLLALHAHNEQAAAAQVVAALNGGERVAYVSDAGTPAVSDPGALLVAAVRAAGHAVVPVPGASSALAALSVAGDTLGQGFRFVGFLPAKGAARLSAVQLCVAAPDTQVLFEAPHRIEALAAELERAAAQGPAAERLVTLCRELTKQFEAITTVPLGHLSSWLAADSRNTRGEFVLVLHAVATSESSNELPTDAARTLRLLMAELPLKQAVGLAAQISGAPRNALYQAALGLRNDSGDV